MKIKFSGTIDLELVEDEPVDPPTPVTRTVGRSYAGPYEQSSAIELDNIDGEVIEKLDVASDGGNIIRLTDCHNIVLRENSLVGAVGNAIELYACSDITVIDNLMGGVATGVYAQECTGNIIVERNDSYGINGPLPRGQMVQLNSCSGAGYRIARNVCDNPVGESGAEDIINLHDSTGTQDSPIMVIGNWIRGGGPSDSGGGILVGDNGGRYYLVADNILVDPGQYGLGIAGGRDAKILNNLVYSAQQPYSNIGLYVWNQYAPKKCGNHEIRGNKVNWTSANGEPGPAWNAEDCGVVDGWDDNDWNADIGPDILPEQILLEPAPWRI